MQNMIPLISGGAYRRPGTFYETKNTFSSQYAPRIFPFIFSRNQSYALIFGNTIGGSGTVSALAPNSNTSQSPLYPVWGPGFGSNTTATHPYVVPLNGNSDQYDEIHDVQFVQTADIMTLVHPNHKPQRVYRINTGFVETGSPAFYIQDFDLPYPTQNPSYNTSQDLGTTAAYNDPYGYGTSLRDAYPYLDQNTSGVTFTASATTGAVTINASSDFFNALQIGAIFKVTHTSNPTVYGSFQITGPTSGWTGFGGAYSTVTANVITPLPNAMTVSGPTQPTSEWWESAWSNYRGWPSTVNYYNNRICYGGTNNEPDSVYFSNANNYDQMSVAQLLTSTAGTGSQRTFLTAEWAGTSTPTVGSFTGAFGVDPFRVQINSNQLNRISYMMSTTTLFVGTLSDEFEIIAGNNGFGADSHSVTPTTHFGSVPQQPVRIGSEFATIKQSGKEIRTLLYDYLQQTYADTSVQLLFDEYPQVEPNQSGNRKYRATAWDNGRKTLWCIDTSGNLFGMTHDKASGMTAWHTHKLGGFNSSQVSTPPGSSPYPNDPSYIVCSGSVISICMIPNPLIGNDDLWMVVKRLINGIWEYDIERMIGENISVNTVYGLNSSGVGQYFVDAATFIPSSYLPGPPVRLEPTNYSGLVPYSNTALSGTASNNQGLFVINTDISGNILQPLPGDWDGEITEINLGLPFTSVIAPVRPDDGSQVGSSQGAVKRIHEIWIRLYKTMGCQIGNTLSNFEDLTFVQPDGTNPPNMQQSNELFTGDQRVMFNGDYDRDGYIVVQQQYPLPFCVVSISATGLEYD